MRQNSLLAGFKVEMQGLHDERHAAGPELGHGLQVHVPTGFVFLDCCMYYL
jgi:hypothetical protein